MLTESQLSFFRTFGYVVMKQAITPPELRTLDVEFNRKLDEQYAHKPFDGSARHWSMLMEDDTPLFASLLEDPRFLIAARQMYGDSVLGIMVDGNRYVGNTGWHPDSATMLQYGVKFAIYLQPVGATTGALRVIPGSHRIDQEKNPDFFDAVYRAPINEVPATVLDSTPGDVVAFDLRLWHSSWGGKTDRRMCTAVYYKDPETPQEIEYIRQQAADNINNAVRSFDAKKKYYFSQKWLANPTRSPERQRWIDRLRKLHYFDAPGICEPVEEATSAR